MTVLAKRYCVEYVDGTIECFRDGFWYSTKGIIIKWTILAAIFLFFTAWFVGGYMHAKRRMKKGLPLLAYHRWLVPYRERQRFGQTPQNHFTFYAAQPYRAQRPDGTYAEPPPMYSNNDAPPGYVPPPGATKMNPNQAYMEMPQYGAAPPPAPAPAYSPGRQENGVVGASGQQQDVEGQHSSPELPPRPKAAMTNFLSKFRR